MELRDYIRILHKSWVLIVVVTLLGVGAGAGFSLLSTPQFESKTQLFVSVRSGDNLNSGELAQGSTFARQTVGSFVEVVTTSVVLEPVITDLALDLTPTELVEQVSASSPVNSVLLNITAMSPSPEQAADIANAVRESFIKVVHEQLAPEQNGVSPIQLATTQPALVPVDPVSPNITVNLALGLLVGLLVGVSIAMLRSMLDTRIHSLHDIGQITAKPLLGGIIDEAGASKNPLVVQSNPNSPRAESFRALRTNLQFLNVGGENRAFVITSPGPGEGKSTTSANLAVSLAQAGSRVVLIEGDLRRPKVSEYMGIEAGSGLTDVLIDKANVDDVMHRWGRSQLYVVPAGRTPPNPSELLGSSMMDDVLDSLNSRFDYVLIDAPPTLLVTDAAVMGKKCAGLIMVVASGATKKQAFEGAVRTLETAGTKLLGIVVTMLATKGPGSYGYGNYGYGAYVEREAEKPETTRRVGRRGKREVGDV